MVSIPLDDPAAFKTNIGDCLRHQMKSKAVYFSFPPLHDLAIRFILFFAETRLSGFIPLDNLATHVIHQYSFMVSATFS